MLFVIKIQNFIENSFFYRVYRVFFKILPNFLRFSWISLICRASFIKSRNIEISNWGKHLTQQIYSFNNFVYNKIAEFSVFCLGNAARSAKSSNLTPDRALDYRWDPSELQASLDFEFNTRLFPSPELCWTCYIIFHCSVVAGRAQEVRVGVRIVKSNLAELEWVRASSRIRHR